MISFVKVIAVGNLTRDPEIKSTDRGKFARLSIATNRRYRDRNTNEIKELPQYHNVVVFNERLIEAVIEPHCRKGQQVHIEGALETRSWDDEAGNKRYATDIVLRAFNGELQLGSRPNGNSGGDRQEGHSEPQPQTQNGDQGGWNGQEKRNSQAGGGQPAPAGSYADDWDSDIPF